jgi:hypothetical protein
MFYDPGRPRGEQPSSEPEIIPPQKRGDSAFSSGLWPSSDNFGVERIYVARLGPLGLASLIFGAGLVTALVLVLLVGAMLLWIPTLTLLVLVGAVAALVQRSLRRRQ